MISYKLKPEVYFNVDEESGRWIFTNNPHKSPKKEEENFDEWDNLIKMLVVNVTDICNLDCIYCSRQCSRKTPNRMDLQLIKTLLKKASAYAKLNNIRITIQFHGGEPLTEFNKILKSIDNLSKEEQAMLKIRIQTNGTLITEKIVKECSKRNIEIGISLDGMKMENNLTRKSKEGKGTFNQIIHSLKLIKKYQKEVSCLTVVTNINIDNLNDILDFFNEIGITNVGFLPLYEEPTTRTINKRIIPNLKQLAESQKKLFDRWIDLLKEDKYKRLNISTFQILIWNLLASNSKTKKFRVNCGVGVNSLFVEEDGTLWGCGAFSYANKLKLGDINEQDLSDVQKGKAYQNFLKRTTSNVEECKECPLQFICKGGCVANGFRKNKNIFEKDIWCEYWEEIIKHIILRIYEEPEIIKLIPNYNIKTN